MGLINDKSPGASGAGLIQGFQIGDIIPISVGFVPGIDQQNYSWSCDRGSFVESGAQGNAQLVHYNPPADGGLDQVRCRVNAVDSSGAVVTDATLWNFDIPERSSSSTPGQSWAGAAQSGIVQAADAQEYDYSKLRDAPLDTAGTYQEGRVADILVRLRTLQLELIAGRLTAESYPQYGFPLFLQASVLTGQIAAVSSAAAGSVNPFWGAIQYEGFGHANPGVAWIPDVPPLVIRQRPIVLPKPNHSSNFFKQAVNNVVVPLAVATTTLGIAPIADVLFPKQTDKVLEKVGVTPAGLSNLKTIGYGEAAVGAVALTIATVGAAAPSVGAAGTAAAGGTAAVATTAATVPSATAIFGTGLATAAAASATKAVSKGGALDKALHGLLGGGDSAKPSQVNPKDSTIQKGFFQTLIEGIEEIFNALFGTGAKPSGG